MNFERPEEGKHYLHKLPSGYHYPDDDPYIIELKRRYPDVLWDRYLPSEVILERIKRYRDRLMQSDPEAAQNIPEVNLPPGTWVYNATWEYNWEENGAEVQRPEALHSEIIP